MDKRSTLISLNGITFGYNSKELVLDDIDFCLKEGDRIALLGGNGAGKTTLFHIILGLLHPLKGSITVLGQKCQREEDFKEVRRSVGLVFQDPDDQLFCPTVIEDVAFGPLNMGLGVKEAQAAALDTLDTLGILHLKDRVPYRLSGGEKRLVSVATVLAMKPEVLLLDEPTTGLDQWVTERLIEVLEGFPLKGLVVISHDPRVTTSIANKHLILRDKKLKETDPNDLTTTL